MISLIFPQQIFVCFGKPTKKTLGPKFIQSHPMATIATSLTIHSSLKIANIGNIGYIIGKCIARNIHILSSCCLLISFLKPKCCFQYIATSVKKIQVYATSCSFTSKTPSSLPWTIHLNFFSYSITLLAIFATLYEQLDNFFSWKCSLQWMQVGPLIVAYKIIWTM